MSKGTIYLDNAASSYPKPDEVWKAMKQFHSSVGANPGRSGHRTSVEAGRILYDTRESLAGLFNIEDPLDIVFTLNATMALNTAIMGTVKAGDHMITSSVEHNSVARPIRYLENLGVEVTRLTCDSKTFDIDLEEVREAIRPNTKLVVLIHGSNVTGTILPVERVSEITKSKGIPLLVDAAQTAGSYPIDVDTMGIDMLAFTGHKSLFGPQGTGGLYVSLKLKIKPLLRGGTGSRSEDDIQPDFMPDRLESGTPNTIGLAGLNAGVEALLKDGIDEIVKHKELLTKRFLEGLAGIDKCEVYGKKDYKDRLATVSLNIKGKQCSQVGQQLDDDYGVLVRCGLHCSPWAHKTLRTYPNGTVRFSFNYLNSFEDVDRTLLAIKDIAG